MSAAQKPQIVFVLGAPGSGKGTICKNLVDKFNFVHLSAGDLLREEQNTAGSEHGDMIKEYIKLGKIVPVEITCGLLKKAIEKSGSDRFLVDGFPRNQNNFDGWQKVMSDCVDVKFVLFLDCSEEVCTDRCLKRGAQGSGRTDDNLESLKKRFNTYTNETMPIINHYEASDMVRRVNTNRTIPEILEDIKEIFSSFNAQS